jgi:hypothetical protein
VLRLLATLCGLSPFLILELVCRITGWGAADLQQDPFVGFAGQRPLFELTEDGQHFRTAASRRGYFKEDTFDATRPADEFRIFVFGGSTVQGNPFSLETSFPRYLEIALRQAAPDRRWKVVNCGGVSYASYRLVPIMQECLSYAPDLFIFCEGHNEFLEDVEYSGIRRIPTAVAWLAAQASRLQSVRWVLNHATASNVDRQADARPLLPVEVDTLLDHDGGLEAYHRDPDHANGVAMHFRANVQRMVRLCRDAEVPLLMILPPSRLTDCPPFKSEFSGQVPDSERKVVADLLRTARESFAGNPAAGLDLAGQAVALDPHYALAWYELGQLQLTAGDCASARQSLLKARDEDICPLRMTSTLEQVLLDVADATQTPLINAQQLLQVQCLGEIVGGSVLVDHVHPSFRGHEDIALAIADWMIADGYVPNARPEWKEQTRSECQRQLAALDDLYFLRGRRALETLQLWAAGRSGGPPLTDNSQNH